MTVSPTDVKAIEEKVMKIMNDAAYREDLAQKCYEKSLKYSWAESAKVYHEAFKNMVK